MSEEISPPIITLIMTGKYAAIFGPSLLLLEHQLTARHIRGCTPPSLAVEASHGAKHIIGDCGVIRRAQHMRPLP